MKKTTHSELWCLYQSTKFVVTTMPIGIDSFAIVTAYHPLGQQLSEEHNQRRQQQLITLLEQENISFWPVIGCSPDLSYQEPSLAISVDKTRALAIASLFKQNAIFVVEADTLWLTPCCIEDQPEVLLGSFSERLVLDKL